MSDAPFKLEQLADLRPAPYNPRRITKAAADGLGLSLTEFGPIDGITWNQRTGVLVAGHQRVAKLKQLGAVFLPGPPPRFKIERAGEVLEFPVRVVDWSPEKEKAANVAANNPKIAGEFTGDLDALLTDVRGSLPEELFVGMQFDALALDLNLGSDRRKPVDEFDLPTSSVIRRGDLFELGGHRLLCGDATSREDVARVLAGAKPDAGYFDPPYGIAYSGKGRRGKARPNDFGEIAGDLDTTAARAAFALVQELAPPPPVQVWWGANYYCGTLPAQRAWIVWDKQIVGDTYSAAELAWTTATGRTRMFRHQWHGMIKASERGEARVHPTQKPIALAVWALDDLKAGRVVLDTFAGSGSSLLACESSSRTCCALELSPVFVEVIVRRWEAFTGQTARLESGETLVDLRASRTPGPEGNASAT